MSTETVNPEVLPKEDNSSLMRSPAAPITLNEIAALGSGALEIIEARVLVLETLRKAAIRATSPEDWLLFRDQNSGLVVGYLQDCGCDRVRDLYGIEIFDIGPLERLEKGSGQDGFIYVVSANGRCRLTGQVVEAMEGGRASTDDFCRDKTGVELELAVRKAARANLDGNITRELAGMKSVPFGDLKAGWEGTSKKTENCRLGRGFGSSASRRGADVEERAGVKASEGPKCPECGARMNFKEGGKTKAGKSYEPFWGCSKYPNCKGTMKDSDFKASAAAPAAQQQPTREPGDIHADDIPF